MNKNEIPWVSVSGSSQIKFVYWDSRTETLYVKFPNGKAYSYDDVSEEEYKELVNAKSIGSYFHSNIKKEKPWAQI